MQVVWVIEGPHAGTFHPFPDDIAREMIEKGTAQSGNIPAHLARKPRYSTREMLSNHEPEQSPVLPRATTTQVTNKKKKKNRK